MSVSVAAVVPAAGEGRRFRDARLNGSFREAKRAEGRSKVFVELGGEPMLAHVLRALDEAPSVTSITVVARQELVADTRELIERTRTDKAATVCAGGPSRSASVANGVAETPSDAQYVLIHDGARPCLTPALVESSIAAAKEHGAAVCGLASAVTIKAADDKARVRLTLDRESLWLVQTPQVFRKDWLVQALARFGERQPNGDLDQFPDDAAILEWAGFPVHLVPGDPLNIKVTAPDDLIVAEAILQHRQATSDANSAPSHAHRNRLR